MGDPKDVALVVDLGNVWAALGELDNDVLPRGLFVRLVKSDVLRNETPERFAQVTRSLRNAPETSVIYWPRRSISATNSRIPS